METYKEEGKKLLKVLLPRAPLKFVPNLCTNTHAHTPDLYSSRLLR